MPSRRRRIRRDPLRDAHYRNYAHMLATHARAYEVLRRGLDVEEETGLSAANDALHIAPRHARALYLRGWALGMLGRLQESRHAMQQILEHDPAHEDARAAVEKIDAALR